MDVILRSQFFYRVFLGINFILKFLKKIGMR